MENITPRVVRGRTELRVEHDGKELAFVHPAEGPNNYQTVGQEILRRELTIPTGEQVASLVYGAFNSQEKEFQEVQNIMRNNYLWVYNRNLWTPEGVYVVKDLNAIGLSQNLDVNELEKKLKDAEKTSKVRFSKDGSVRFVSRECYKLEEHTSESLSKDGFVIASFGKIGAEKLGKVSTKFSHSPYTWGIETDKDPIQRLSALYSLWGDYRLFVIGSGFGNYGGGFAFGV